MSQFTTRIITFQWSSARRLVFFQAEAGIRDSDRDWSSDVCSSDLVLPIGTLLAMLGALLSLAGIAHALRAHVWGVGLGAVGFVVGVVPSVMVLHQYRLARTEIGRASCRERV